MSVPARSGTYVCAIALVRVNRGSTWMTVAPRALASITHWNPTGWHSAMFEPWLTMQFEFARSCWNVVVPLTPKLITSTWATVAGQMGTWFTLHLGDPAVGHEHLLPAADRAVRADRAGDGVGGLRAGGDRLRARGPDRRATAGRVASGELAVHRPAPDPGAQPHAADLMPVRAGESSGPGEP